MSQAKDPVTAIANAAGELFEFAQVLGMRIGERARMARERLPDWLSPKDFQQEDRTPQLIIGAGALIFIALVVAIILVNRNR